MIELDETVYVVQYQQPGAEEWQWNNYCRCTGEDAVRQVLKEMREDEKASMFTWRAFSRRVIETTLDW